MNRPARSDPSWLVVVMVAVAARALILCEWVFGQDLGYGDLTYYWTRMARLADIGAAATLQEYPTPVVWLLALPHTLSDGSEAGYVLWFVVCAAATDLAFCLLLWRTAAPHRGAAIIVWSLLCVLLGPLIWLRFDLLPAVLVGLAAVTAARRPAASGVLLAAGAATKLWPGVLFPLLLNRPSAPRARAWIAPTAGFAGAGVILGTLSLITGGWDRLFSPLGWQSDRGLQIEAIPATVLMVRRLADPAMWPIYLSRYQAFEIFGPGVDIWLRVATLLGVLGLICGVAVLMRHWRRAYACPREWADGVATAMLALIALLIVTNKTLSPQYILWLGGPLAALVARHGLGVREVRRWTVAVLGAAALTHLVYPVLYDLLNGLDPHALGTPWSTAVLVMRNVVLLAFTVDLLTAALRRVSFRPAN